jgi:cytochrome b561
VILRNTRTRWGVLSQLLHWLIAALIGVQIALGLIGTELPLSMAKLATLARHKSLGITLLALMLLRLAWRALNPTPSLPDTLRPHERVLAHLTHTGLYVLVIALPLSGWIMSSARGFPVSWFNLVQLPNLVGRNATLYHTMVRLHVLLAIALGLLLVLHIAAAFKHHFVLRDDTLRRMLPGAGTAFTGKE